MKFPNIAGCASGRDGLDLSNALTASGPVRIGPGTFGALAALAVLFSGRARKE